MILVHRSGVALAILFQHLFTKQSALTPWERASSDECTANLKTSVMISGGTLVIGLGRDATSCWVSLG